METKTINNFEEWQQFVEEHKDCFSYQNEKNRAPESYPCTVVYSIKHYPQDADYMDLLFQY